MKFFKKVVENFAVRGKVVGNRSALVFFIDKPGLGKAHGVFRDCFEIATQTIGDFFNSNARVLGDQRQNFNPPVVGHAFKMPLHLFCRLLTFCHTSIISQHSYILENVGMLWLDVKESQKLFGAR